MSELLKLAERCEQATGPDRGLDQDIMDALVRIGVLGFPVGLAHFRVTASLDAAMTLVPEGWWVQHLGHCLTGWRARIETNGPPSHSIGVGFGKDRTPATPALALCAASLRALAAQEPSS